MFDKPKVLPILIEGNPILRQKCEPITPDYPNLKKFIANMYATLEATATGVGLAAPQVGKTIRLFILGGGPKHSYMPKITFINPEIITMKGSRHKEYEGCLSVPKIYGIVERWQKVKINYLDEDFNEQIKIFKNFEARVIQHEYDHMNGIEFYDEPHMSIDDFKRIGFAINALRNGKIPKVDYKINKRQR